MRRLPLTLVGIDGLSVTLLSSSMLALAPNRLLLIFRVLVGCGGGDRAVLCSWATPPAGRKDSSDRLVFIVTCHFYVLM